MEEDSAELRSWVQAQGDYTTDKLAKVPGRVALRERFEELVDADEISLPLVRNNRYFYRERHRDQELSVLFCRDGETGTPRELIDQNLLSADQSTTLADIYPSNDGQLIAYRLSESGNSRMQLKVMDATTGTILPDVIPAELNPIAHIWHSKNQACWSPNNNGFFYTRRPSEVHAGEERYHQKLYYHRLGEDCSDDEIVFGDSLSILQAPFPQLSSDGRFLLVTVQNLCKENAATMLYLCDLTSLKKEFILVVPGNLDFVTAHLHRNFIYLRTNHDAPFGKLLALRLDSVITGNASPITVLAEQPHTIKNWSVVADYIVVETIENASSRLRFYDLYGNLVKEVPLPQIASVEDIQLIPETDELLFTVSSFVTPQSVYRVDLKTLESRLYQKPATNINSKQFAVDQVWYMTHDNARVPMFLIYKKGMQCNGNNATVMSGYGGFNVCQMPSFQAHIIPFLEKGGLYAVPCIRGGGEFGETWHRAGMRSNKQNVFSDFIAAAQWLIANDYTKQSKLGCYGRSNGGLLVNAVAVQRPDLWQAIVAGAPVTDMARFHLTNAGKNWIAEYGSPENVSDLEYLMHYSPYHNLPPKIKAPAILISVPAGDDRVAPWHGHKMLAAWQAANVSRNPVLLHCEEKAGHKGSASRRGTIDRFTDIWSFIFWQLDLI